MRLLLEILDVVLSPGNVDGQLCAVKEEISSLNGSMKKLDPALRISPGEDSYK
jgi:hypothetical protein